MPAIQQAPSRMKTENRRRNAPRKSVRPPPERIANPPGHMHTGGIKIASRTDFEGRSIPRRRSNSIRPTNEIRRRALPICRFRSGPGTPPARVHPDNHPPPLDRHRISRATDVFPCNDEAPRTDRNPHANPFEAARGFGLINAVGIPVRVRVRFGPPVVGLAARGAHHLSDDPIGSGNLVTG